MLKYAIIPKMMLYTACVIIAVDVLCRILINPRTSPNMNTITVDSVMP